MIRYKNILFGVLFLTAAILLELFWFSTGAESLGFFTLIFTLISSGFLVRSICTDYETSNQKLRKFFTITGLEN